MSAHSESSQTSLRRFHRDFIVPSRAVHRAQAGLRLMIPPPPVISKPDRFVRRNATALKLLFVAFLVLLLLVPLHLVESTLHERLERHAGAVAKITHAFDESENVNTSGAVREPSS